MLAPQPPVMVCMKSCGPAPTVTSRTSSGALCRAPQSCMSARIMGESSPVKCLPTCVRVQEQAWGGANLHSASSFCSAATASAREVGFHLV